MQIKLKTEKHIFWRINQGNGVLGGTIGHLKGTLTIQWPGSRRSAKLVKDFMEHGSWKLECE